MSKKNKSRLSKKQKHKERRKTKRCLGKMYLEGKQSGSSYVVAGGREQTTVNNRSENNPLAEQRPSPSRRCKRQKSPKRSPWRNAGGKVNRFKKIVDDQARRLVKRSVYLMKDCETLRKVTPKKFSPQKKTSKRLINKHKNNKRENRKKEHNSSNSTLEEGEIRSQNEEDEDDDDCIVVEPIFDEITIDDDIDIDNIPSTSDITTSSYQALMSSFEKCVSSTPCQNKKSPPPCTSSDTDNDKDNKSPTGNCLPFFVDVAPYGGTESINSTDNFADYVKLSMLNEKSQQKRRSVRLKSTRDFGEVIDLDDSDTDTESTLKCKYDLDDDCDVNSTMKCMSENLVDDSVVFISETNKNDFIPISDDNMSSYKVLKVQDSAPKTPVTRLSTNNLFTQSETKKLNAYNENAYNPSNKIVLTSGKRMVLIDGSNVAFKHGLDQKYSVQGLKIAIDYFEKMGHEVKAVIPQFRMNKSKSTNPEELERLHKAGKIVQTPCKNLPGHTSTSYDDRFILQLAFALDAAIVSNDNYRDLLFENPAFKKIVENRVIGYTWCNDIFILPKDPYGKWGPKLSEILNRR